jgi:hypothetical protein
VIVRANAVASIGLRPVVLLSVALLVSIAAGTTTYDFDSTYGPHGEVTSSTDPAGVDDQRNLPRADH